MYLLICCPSVLPACISVPCMSVYAFMDVYALHIKSEELPDSYTSLCRHGELAFFLYESKIYLTQSISSSHSDVYVAVSTFTRLQTVPTFPSGVLTSPEWNSKLTKQKLSILLTSSPRQFPFYQHFPFLWIEYPGPPSKRVLLHFSSVSGLLIYLKSVQSS